MAGYYNTSMQELDDTYRLLPREILEDIGIMDPPEQQLHDVIEDLAARLVAVLGGTGTPKTKPDSGCAAAVLAGASDGAPPRWHRRFLAAE
nr:unnamed protein product [Digitaria exilis]